MVGSKSTLCSTSRIKSLYCLKESTLPVVPTAVSKLRLVAGNAVTSWKESRLVSRRLLGAFGLNVANSPGITGFTGGGGGLTVLRLIALRIACATWPGVKFCDGLKMTWLLPAPTNGSPVSVYFAGVLVENVTTRACVSSCTRDWATTRDVMPRPLPL